MQEMLEFLRKFVADGKSVAADKATEIANFLKASPGLQPVYQAIYDTGHGDATGRARSRERELERERDNLKEERDKLNSDLEEYKSKTPDAAKIEEKYKGEIAKLEDQNKALRKAHQEERVQWHKDQAKRDIAAALVKQGVDPDYAEFLASKPETDKRISVTSTDDGVKVEIFREGSEVPLQADKPLEALASELRKTVNAKFIVSNASDGSGDRDGSGGNKSTVFDKVREDQKKVAEKVGGSTRPEGFKSGAERLGVV